MNDSSAAEILAAISNLRTELGAGSGADRTVESLCDSYLNWSGCHNKEGTFARVNFFIRRFCDFQYAGQRLGQLKVSELRTHHASSWLDANPSWRGSRRDAIAAIKSVFNFSVREGHIKGNPLASLRKPAARARQRILSAAEKQLILNAIDEGDPFRDFVSALLATGARPGEVAAVCAENVSIDEGAWIFDQHKTSKKTGRARVVYLTPAMVELTTRLMANNPTGTLFRNTAGRAWTGNAIRCRFRRLRKKLNLQGVSAYTTRHSWVTDALEAGVPIASVAELAGHTDTKMISQHYSKLSEKRNHLREMVNKAAGCEIGKP